MEITETLAHIALQIEMRQRGIALKKVDWNLRRRDNNVFPRETRLYIRMKFVFRCM